MYTKLLIAILFAFYLYNTQNINYRNLNAHQIIIILAIISLVYLQYIEIKSTENMESILGKNKIESSIDTTKNKTR